MPGISPTADGFRAAFRRPSLTLAEMAWRWSVGGAAVAIFFFGLYEYLGSLPVSETELLLLRTNQPYLVARAIGHILQGSLNRVVAAGLFAVLMLILLWMIVGALGRIATVRSLLAYFRSGSVRAPANASQNGQMNATGSNLTALVRLNFLRVAVVVGVLFGILGAVILSGFMPDSLPGFAFLLFVFLATVVCFCGWMLNWFLSLAQMLAVRDGTDALGSMSEAVSFCRERFGAVLAVSTWTGLAHLVVFVAATTVASLPLGMAGILPWRAVACAVAFISLVYFALSDWLYMARLAGYVRIGEMPEPAPIPIPPAPIISAPPQTAVDRDELILSDVPLPS